MARGHERWQSLLDADGVTVVILDAADRERLAAELIRASTAWRITFDDGRVLVAQRAQL